MIDATTAQLYALHRAIVLLVVGVLAMQAALTISFGWAAGFFFLAAVAMSAGLIVLAHTYPP